MTFPDAGTALRGLMRRVPAGVSVVASGDADAPAAMTVNSLISVSLDPPTVLVSLGRGSRTETTVSRTRTFTVSLLSEAQDDIARQFARPGAPRSEGLRREGAAWVVPGAAAHLHCQVIEALDVEDHVVVVARVQEFMDAGDEVLNSAAQTSRAR